MTSSFLFSASLYEFSQFNGDVKLTSTQSDKRRSTSETYNDMVTVVQTQLKELLHLAGHIFIDYQIAETKFKADAVVLYRGLIFVMLFKSGESAYKQVDVESLQKFAFALKAHHQPSADKFIIPVLISTNAMPQGSEIHVSPEGIFNTMLDNGNNFAALLEHFANQFKADEINSSAWGKVL